MTTPMGKLAWGQAGNYDAADDRAVITALARNRLGMVWPAEVVPGAGLSMTVKAGWLGVASCGDLTTAVVGARVDNVVQASAGPATGSREDFIWCDTNADEGTWELRIIPVSGSGARFGIALARIIVPAGANLATQMDIIPFDATLDRRLMAYANFNFVNQFFNAVTWQDAVGHNMASQPVLMEPGQWYRARLTASSPRITSAGPSWEGRLGIGYRNAAQGVTNSTLARTSVIAFPTNNTPTHVSVEWITRYPKNSPRIEWVFDARMWIAGNATYMIGAVQGQGDHCVLTVEDIGS
jgi:hypothetical protein